jgi:hypothetical protein
MLDVRPFAPLAAALLVTLGTAQEEAVPPWQPPAELHKAQARAQVHNKRVLAVFAAPGEDLAAALKKDRAIARRLLYEFETVPLAGDAAEACAQQWQLDDGRPALVVLAADGEVRAKLAPADFIEGGAIASEALLAKLKPHECSPVDAEQKLAAGLAEAKKTGRAVFVRFDAPW